MFAELEKHIFSSEAKTVNDDSASVELTQIGKQINIDEILQACYNEVATKNGTKLVLSAGLVWLVVCVTLVKDTRCKIIYIFRAFDTSKWLSQVSL